MVENTGDLPTQVLVKELFGNIPGACKPSFQENLLYFRGIEYVLARHPVEYWTRQTVGQVSVLLVV